MYDGCNVIYHTSTSILQYKVSVAMNNFIYSDKIISVVLNSGGLEWNNLQNMIINNSFIPVHYDYYYYDRRRTSTCN